MPTMPPFPSFYQVRGFVPHCLRTVERQCDRSLLHYDSKFELVMETVMQHFDRLIAVRAGTLVGDYMLLEGAALLIRRDGMFIHINTALEDASACAKVEALGMAQEFMDTSAAALSQWDSVPVVEHEPFLYHIYFNNYYHWSLEALPQQRLFGRSKNNAILVFPASLKHKFQRDSLALTAKGRTVIPLTMPVILRDPILVSEELSEEGLWWLRRTTGITVSSGRRRIYLRRTTSTRAGLSGLCETPEVLDFLKQNGFETIEFGDRPMGIAEQVKLFDGAAVILAPHGAALTNLAYLNPPLSVIEVMGPKAPWAVFMAVSSMCGFHHHVVFSYDYDKVGNIKVPASDLSAALTACDPPRLA